MLQILDTSPRVAGSGEVVKVLQVSGEMSLNGQTLISVGMPEPPSRRRFTESGCAWDACRSPQCISAQG